MIADQAFEVLQLEVDRLHVVLEGLALSKAQAAKVALVVLDILMHGARVDVQAAVGPELHVTDRALEVPLVPMDVRDVLL